MTITIPLTSKQIKKCLNGLMTTFRTFYYSL